MINYGIKIDVGRLLHYSAPLKPQIDNETLLTIISSFSSYIRKLYLTMLHEEINSNRYKGVWEPVEDPDYLEYLGTKPDISLEELMYDALEVVKLKDSIVIRIDPEYEYPGSKRTLIEVVRAIDNGTSKFNARPILKRVVRKIETNLPSLWKGYLKRKGVA